MKECSWVGCIQDKTGHQIHGVLHISKIVQIRLVEVLWTTLCFGQLKICIYISLYLMVLRSIGL